MVEVRRLNYFVVLTAEFSWKYFGSRDGNLPRFLKRLFDTGFCKSIPRVSSVFTLTGVQNGNLAFLSNSTSNTS